MANQYVQAMLGEKEEVLLVSRQHWFVLFKNILLELVLILLIAAIVAALLILIPVLVPWAALGLIVWIIPIVGIIHDFLVWSNRQFIVTSRRVIQVNGIINKNVIDSSLEKVNDVHMVQPFWGRIFGFGDVEILTASEQGNNLFKYIGDPVRFKTTMLNAKEAMGLDEHLAIFRPPAEGDEKQEIPRMIAELDDLRKRGVLTEEEFQTKKKDLLAKI
jgi:uncharacterized membrane protein YdbT with pleckstrin-like domain